MNTVMCEVCHLRPAQYLWTLLKDDMGIHGSWGVNTAVPMCEKCPLSEPMTVGIVWQQNYEDVLSPLPESFASEMLAASEKLINPGNGKYWSDTLGRMYEEADVRPYGDICALSVEYLRKYLNRILAGREHTPVTLMGALPENSACAADCPVTYHIPCTECGHDAATYLGLKVTIETTPAIRKAKPFCSTCIQSVPIQLIPRPRQTTLWVVAALEPECEEALRREWVAGGGVADEDTLAKSITRICGKYYAGRTGELMSQRYHLWSHVCDLSEGVGRVAWPDKDADHLHICPHDCIEVNSAWPSPFYVNGDDIQCCGHFRLSDRSARAMRPTEEDGLSACVCISASDFQSHVCCSTKESIAEAVVDVRAPGPEEVLYPVRAGGMNCRPAPEVVLSKGASARLTLAERPVRIGHYLRVKGSLTVGTSTVSPVELRIEAWSAEEGLEARDGRVVATGVPPSSREPRGQTETVEYGGEELW